MVLICPCKHLIKTLSSTLWAWRADLKMTCKSNEHCIVSGQQLLFWPGSSSDKRNLLNLWNRKSAFQVLLCLKSEGQGRTWLLHSADTTRHRGISCKQPEQWSHFTQCLPSWAVSTGNLVSFVIKTTHGPINKQWIGMASPQPHAVNCRSCFTFGSYFVNEGKDDFIPITMQKSTCCSQIPRCHFITFQLENVYCKSTPLQAVAAQSVGTGLRKGGFLVQALVPTQYGRCSGSRERFQNTFRELPRCPWAR